MLRTPVNPEQRLSFLMSVLNEHCPSLVQESSIICEDDFWYSVRYLYHYLFVCIWADETGALQFSTSTESSSIFAMNWK